MMLGLSYLRKAAVSAKTNFVLNVAVLLLLSTAKVSAQTAKIDYQQFCASCHGIHAEGGKEVDIPGPDLTHLSQNNGGRFSLSGGLRRGGRPQKAAAHERLLSMPLWGEYFRTARCFQGCLRSEGEIPNYRSRALHPKPSSDPKSSAEMIGLVEHHRAACTSWRFTSRSSNRCSSKPRREKVLASGA